MHEIGIVHRDLKLDNIMIQKNEVSQLNHERSRVYKRSNTSQMSFGSNEEMRIIDFGLSVNIDQS
jgi:serine/threonine protein kinase